MNGKIKKELERLGLTSNGNRFYGALYGYETNAYVNMYGLFVNVSMYKTVEQQDAIQHDLLLVKTKYTNWQWNNYGLTFILTDITMGALAKKLETMLTSFYETFAKNGALGVGYCPVCGKQLDLEATKKCLIDGNSISIDNDCVDKINATITSENAQFDAAPNNYLRGFAGALIGGIAGAAIAIILQLVGFISAISAFVAFFVGILLYKKFGGKPNKMMLVIVTVTTFACMILSVVCAYIMVSGIEATKAGLDMSAIDAFKYVMRNEEVSRTFWADMAMTVLFTVLGCVWEIINNARKIKRQKNI